MIHDWSKYEAFRGNNGLIKSLRGKFLSLSDDDFYDLFQDSMLMVFPVFAEKYNPERSKNEIGFMYRLIYNTMIDNLKNMPNRLQDALEKIDSFGTSDYPAEFELDSNVPSWTFSDFLHKVISNRTDIKSVRKKVKDNKVTLPKHYEIHPLIKMKVWSADKQLSSNDIDTIAKRIHSDTKSHHHFEWREPMPIVRIKSWVGCT